jgi:hypothetical protein
VVLVWASRLAMLIEDRPHPRVSLRMSMMRPTSLSLLKTSKSSPVL